MAWARFDDALRGSADAIRNVFTFTAGAKPTVRYAFTRSPSPPSEPLSRSASPTHQHRSLKRTRPLHDVDGDVLLKDGRKKRRLRLILITSRLSRPFSSPSTHIIDRGPSKIAVWAKQKALGRILLRKAAILNRIRRHAIEARESQQRELEAAREAFLLQQAITAQLPRRSYLPLPPSPLGLSNYDAFDLEDDIYRNNGDDDDDCFDPSSNDEPLIYSDFNILDHSEPVVDDHDSLGEQNVPDQAPKSPKMSCVKESELSVERERQKKLLFIPFVC